MKCWDCGQELDVSAIERQASRRVADRIVHALYRDAEALRGSGEFKAADALESLADELATAP